MADEVEEITLIGNGGDEPPISLYLKKDELNLIKRDPVYADIIYRNALRAYKTNAQKDTSSESKEEEQNVQDPSDKSVAKESDTITSDDLPKLSSIRWGREATLSLLKIYKELEWKLSDPTVKKKAVWQEISSSLEENGFIFSPDKCERKMLNMKRDYKSVIDHNNTTGNDRKSHPYMDELHSIFGLKPSVKPLSIAASFNTDKFAPKTNESVHSEKEVQKESRKEKGKEPRKRKADKSSDIVEIVNTINAKSDERFNMLITVQQQQMQIMQQLVSAFTTKTKESNNEP